MGNDVSVDDREKINEYILVKDRLFDELNLDDTLYLYDIEKFNDNMENIACRLIDEYYASNKKRQRIVNIAYVTCFILKIDWVKKERDGILYSIKNRLEELDDIPKVWHVHKKFNHF